MNWFLRLNRENNEEMVLGPFSSEDEAEKVLKQHENQYPQDIVLEIFSVNEVN